MEGIYALVWLGFLWFLATRKNMETTLLCMWAVLGLSCLFGLGRLLFS